MKLIDLINKFKFKQTKKMENQNQNEEIANTPGPVGPVGEQGAIGVDGIEDTNSTSNTIADKLKDVIGAIKVQNSTGKLDGTLQHLEVGFQSYRQVMGV